VAEKGSKIHSTEPKLESLRENQDDDGSEEQLTTTVKTTNINTNLPVSRAAVTAVICTALNEGPLCIDYVETTGDATSNGAFMPTLYST